MAVYNNLPTQGGGKWELLWTNPNPTSAINSAITVQHDMTQYEYVFVSMCASTTHTNYPILVQSRRGSTWVACNQETTDTWMSYRRFAWNDTQFQIGYTAGYSYHNGGNATGGTYGIILAVYGVKRLNLG